MDDKMKFSKKLITLRKSRGLSQEEFANEINVTRQTISKWELGTTIPDMEKLKLISNYFGVSIDELVSETNINEKQYVDDKEFVGVDEKYIPKKDAEEVRKSYVEQNKKSNKVILARYLPFIIVLILIIVIMIFMFTMFNKMSNKTETTTIFDKATNMIDKTTDIMDKATDMMDNTTDMMDKALDGFDNTLDGINNTTKDVTNLINEQNEQYEKKQKELEEKSKQEYEKNVKETEDKMNQEYEKNKKEIEG